MTGIDEKSLDDKWRRLPLLTLPENIKNIKNVNEFWRVLQLWNIILK